MNESSFANINTQIETTKQEELSPEASECIRCHIQKGVKTVIDSGLLFLPELRKVSVLFINLKISSLESSASVANDIVPDTESLISSSADIFRFFRNNNEGERKTEEKLNFLQIHQALEIMQTSLFRYEGEVRQFLVDDKGTVLIGIFGAPTCSEDDSFRAVQAAIEIHAKLNEIKLVNSIGITTGSVFTGGVGNQRRQEYALVGDVVNLSARLMVASKNGILCDEPTYKENTYRFHFERLDPIKVKGKSHLISIYKPCQMMTNKRSVLWEKVRIHFLLSKKIVARKNELFQLQKLCKEKSGVIFFEGEMGLGKTLLLRQTLKETQKNGIRCFYSAGNNLQKSTPFYPWRSIFHEIFGTHKLANKSEEERKEKVLSQLGKWKKYGNVPFTSQSFNQPKKKKYKK